MPPDRKRDRLTEELKVKPDLSFDPTSAQFNAANPPYAHHSTKKNSTATLLGRRPVGGGGGVGMPGQRASLRDLHTVQVGLAEGE